MSVHFDRTKTKSNSELAEKLFRHLKDNAVDKLLACTRSARYYGLKHSYVKHRCEMCGHYQAEHESFAN